MQEKTPATGERSLIGGALPPAVLRLLESHPCVLKCMPGAGTLRACAQAAAAH